MTQIVEGIDCPKCGAPLPAKPGEVIVTCEYCGAALNMATGQKYFLKHAIIPAPLDRQGAQRLARQWMGGGFLKPEDLASASQIQEVSLTFLPFFVILVKATSRYKGLFTRTGQQIPRQGELLKEHYWKILARRASSFPVKEYEIPLSGKVDFDISRVQQGAQFLNAEFDEEEAKQRLRSEMEEHHKYLLQDEVDVVTEIETKVEAINTEFVHAPVWTIKYAYAGKLYSLLIDGASGQTIKGDIPPPDLSSKGFFKSLKKGFFGR